MAKIEYSCKRKKDFVTFTAIAMFVAICLFEVYLVIFLKIQMKQENSMAHEVIKQEMLLRTERIRRNTRSAKPKNTLNECEVMLATSCLDSIVQFIRKNKDDMTDQQIVEANEMLFELETYTLPWSGNKYLFQREEFKVQPILNKIEAKLDQAAASGR